jgi:hypothetical protein
MASETIIKNGVEIEVKTIDIWSTVYSSCLQGHLVEGGKIAGKTLYKDALDRNYFLTDSRYGEEFYL